MAGRRNLFKPSTENNRSYYGKRALHLHLQSWAKASKAPIKKYHMNQGIGLGHGPGNIHGFILPARIGYCSIINCAHRFRNERSDVACNLIISVCARLSLIVD